MGKRTVRDAIVGFIEGITPDSKVFWGPIVHTPRQKINLTQVNNYYILENGKPKLVKREIRNEKGELLREEDIDD